MSTITPLNPLQEALATATPVGVRAAIDQTIAPDATIHMCHPFGTITGAQVFDALFAPLLVTLPDLERRDMIVFKAPPLKDKIGSAAWEITWARWCAHGLIFRPQAIWSICVTTSFSAFRTAWSLKRRSSGTSPS